MSRNEADDPLTVRLSAASPSDIRSWSYGEVKKADDFDATSRPVRDGLFCERIFGPLSDPGERGRRMGHVELMAPVAHPWFFRRSDVLATLLDWKPWTLENVLSFADHVVLDPAYTPLKRGQLLTGWDRRRAEELYGYALELDSGPDAIKRLLEDLCPVRLSAQLRQEIDAESQKDRPSRPKLRRLSKRLELVEAFRGGADRHYWAVRPEWMILWCIPVIPPALRPPGDDLNELYCRVILRNNRLKRLVYANAADAIIIYEKRRLQQSVEALLDNRSTDRPVRGERGRRLTSLTDRVRQPGRFSERLWDGQPDAVVRAVVPDPTLTLVRCGLPQGLLGAPGVARRRVLLRSPTSDRRCVQAFEPMPCDGDAVRLHPLLCTGFDGGPVAVHLPRSIEAQAETATLMTPADNLVGANGELQMRPSWDVVAGCYHLTASPRRGNGRTFASVEEVGLAYSLGKLRVHERVRVRLPRGRPVVGEGRVNGGRQSTTVGRVLFNDALDARMPFYDLPMTADNLDRVVSDCHSLLGRRAAVELLRRLTLLGCREATRSGLSIAASDLKPPANKGEVLRTAEWEVRRFERQYERGEITEIERFGLAVEQWTKAASAINRAAVEGLQDLDPLRVMAFCGADQVRQLCGMAGLRTKPNGSLIELPIRASLREGFGVLEYFVAALAARNEAASAVARQADAENLTRKLIGAAQSVVVTMEDCGTTHGVRKEAVYKGDDVLRPLAEVIRGRVSRHTIDHPVTGERIVSENELIGARQAARIEALGIDRILVRSPLTCLAPHGVCRLCHGTDLSTGALVEEGTALGVIAALALGGAAAHLIPRRHNLGSGERSLGQAATRKAGKIEYSSIETVCNDRGERVALTDGVGELRLAGPGGNFVEAFVIPHGAVLLVSDGDVLPGRQDVVLARWDPYRLPILSRWVGTVRLVDLVEGQTLRQEGERWVVTEHRGDLRPQVRIENELGQVIEAHFLPENAVVEVRPGQAITAGAMLAMAPRPPRVRDVVTGLPRLWDLLEAREPEHKAVLAQLSGVARLRVERDRRFVTVRQADEQGHPLRDAWPVEHDVPRGSHVRKWDGERVRAGQPLTLGERSPHDLLRILGVEAVSDYLCREILDVYRLQGQSIDDRHVELIVARMLRHVRIQWAGDTGLVPGALVDRFDHLGRNERLGECVKIKEAGDSNLHPGQVVGKEAYEHVRQSLQAEGKKPPTGEEPQRALCEVVLLGISEVARRSESLLSAASVDPIRVLVAAAVAGKVDRLEGLTQNVMLGRLIPAGTGFVARR